MGYDSFVEKMMKHLFISFMQNNKTVLHNSWDFCWFLKQMALINVQKKKNLPTNDVRGGCNNSLSKLIIVFEYSNSSLKRQSNDEIDKPKKTTVTY